MRKFKLEMEALEVESFATSSAMRPFGTVHGNEMVGPDTVAPITLASNEWSCDSCQPPLCTNRPTPQSNCCA